MYGYALNMKGRQFGPFDSRDQALEHARQNPELNGRRRVFVGEVRYLGDLGAPALAEVIVSPNFPELLEQFATFQSKAGEIGELDREAVKAAVVEVIRESGCLNGLWRVRELERVEL